MNKKTQGNIFWSTSVTLAVEKRRSWSDRETLPNLSCPQIWKQKVANRNVGLSENVCSKTTSSDEKLLWSTIYIQSSIWVWMWGKSDLHGGAGEGVHDTLGQGAGGRRLHHLLVLWSRQGSQDAHYNLMSSWFLTVAKVLQKLFHFRRQCHPDLPFSSGVWGTLSMPKWSG